MTLADLARILRQPGYSVDDPNALMPVTLAQAGAHAVLQGENVYLDSPSQSRAFHGVSTWRNEREFMAAVIAECDLRAIGHPAYGLIYHNANENAHRQPGVRAGIPDLFLPVVRVSARGDICGGLYVELKIGSGKCSQAQLAMHHRLRREGYHCVVIWDSVDEVMREIEEYLRL